MKVITLPEFGELRFIELLTTLAETSQDKNRSWFPALLKNFPTYNEWFFVVDDQNEFIAFSTIQTFYEGCYRLLTRCYIMEQYRRTTLPKYDTYMSPASFMVQAQLAWLGQYTTIFVSLEDIRRSRTIINMAQKMSINTNTEWYVSAMMHQTCGDVASKQCWQNICYAGELPTLPSITKEEWINRYGK